MSSVQAPWQQADLSTIVIASKPPSYSEVWMHRMTDVLRPNVSAVYFQPKPTNEVDYPTRTLLPNWTRRLPVRLCLTGGTGFPTLINRRLRSHLATQPPSRLLIHYATNAVLLERTLAAIDWPVYVHCHGHDVTWGRRMERLPMIPAQPRGYVESVRRLARRVRFIANSAATVEALREIGIANDRIAQKPLGVPVPASCPPLPALGDDGLQVAYIGRLTDFKGPVETIQAFGRFREAGHRGTLRMAGAGDQRVACEEAVAASRYADDIELLGAIDADGVQRLLARSHVFTAHNKRSTITGQQEAFGVSVVEAMAAGRPVVTGASGGVCETVVDGETGTLFPPGDIDAHAAALAALAERETLRSDCGRAGHARAAARYSIESEGERLREIFATCEAVEPELVAS